MKKIKILILCTFLSLVSFGQNIYGGSQIDIAEAPYQVSIETTNQEHICGGIILSDRWILTAAHCVAGLPAWKLKVHAGSTNFSNNNIGQRILNIGQIYVNNGWAGQSQPNATLEHDIALLYLDDPLEFNSDVQPIEYANYCNTTIPDISDPKEAFLTGWGVTCATCPLSSNLKAIWKPFHDRILSMAVSFALDPANTRVITNNMISFYESGSNTSAGSGDSGGPAVINHTGNKINIGVTSWSHAPREINPSVYVNVRNYSGWIDLLTGISSSSGIDLYTKDRPWDMAEEPFDHDNTYTSEDIWVRNQDDDIEIHQNPEYYALPGNTNYVKVRVRNKGCIASNGDEKLKLYWAKAATYLTWPSNWNGGQSVNNQSLGDYLGEVTLPVIEPGHAYIATFQWNPPNPENYVGLSSDPLFWAEHPHHFCLLSRIEAAIDPMTVIEGYNITANIKNNNNISLKNLSVVDLDQNNFNGGFSSADDMLVGASVLVGDGTGVGGTYDLEFKNHEGFVGNKITDEAEVRITLEELVWNKWIDGGSQGTDIEVFDALKHQIILTSASGKIENLNFAANEIGLIHVSFNFLVEEISGTSKFEFLTNQLESGSDVIIGGELFRIAVPIRPDFEALASNNQEITVGESVDLSAIEIGENAIYNWYDENGVLIHTGLDLTVTPSVSQKYKLEVIATLDGFKDYSEVEVEVENHKILSYSPNPASTIVNIGYLTENTTSAYIMLVRNSDNVSNQYIINPSIGSTQIDVSNYSSGLYTAVLVCDGEIKHAVNIAVQ